MNNLQMAEKMGVFKVIKNLACDASMQVSKMREMEQLDLDSKFGNP